MGVYVLNNQRKRGPTVAEIEIKSYRYTYAGAEKPCLDIEALSISRGETVLLIGASGSGKTTLLRRLADQKGLRGEASGELKNTLKSYGYVWQEPGAQMVCDRVEHEIVFGMENHGFSPEMMYRRLAEMTVFFGLEPIIKKDVIKLSAGQQQKVSIAGELAMDPELLLLDEPTGLLDPVAAEDLAGLIKKIRDELGTTIIIAEQRAQLFMRSADRIIYMDGGKVLCDTTPKEIETLPDDKKELLYPYMPVPVKIAIQKGVPAEVYLDDRSLRSWFREFISGEEISKKSANSKQSENPEKSDILISAKGVYFCYEKNAPYAVSDCEFSLEKGLATFLVGGNGSGKTTLSQIVAGLLKETHGRVRYNGIKKSDIAYLPSDPRFIFDEIIDVSVGERKWLAIEKIFEKNALVYILDEPTAALDPSRKNALKNMIREKTAAGKTLLIITHDMEFCAGTADRMAMMYDGRVVAYDEKRRFFEDNIFYTTALHRLTRATNNNILIEADI